MTTLYCATENQLGWLNLPPPVTVITTSCKILEDQLDEGIDGYGGKDFEKRKVLKREWKTPRERSTSGPGSKHDEGEELGDDDGPD